MEPVKVSFPGSIYSRFMQLAKSLGYGKRGDRWKLLDLLFAYASEHSSIFKKR